MAATIGGGNIDSMVLTGLYPKNAENRAPVGGILLRIGASFTAPMPASDVSMASGNLWVIPIITIVKNMAILAVNEVFIMVNIIPEATPLSCGGTEFIILELFGEPNIPPPTPIINRTNPNSK